MIKVDVEINNQSWLKEIKNPKKYFSTKLKKISNICIHVKSQNTAYIQKAHMSILHCICEIIDNGEV